MISVKDIASDPDMAAPKPFQILRSSGEFTSSGFQSTVTTLLTAGPVQRATPKDILMVPEADRVGAIMAFWAVIPVYTTRGLTTPTGVQNVEPQGDYPGNVYTLDPPVPSGVEGSLYLNGLFQIPVTQYSLSSDGSTITMTTPTQATDSLYFTWTNVEAGFAASDILVYESIEYRVLSSKHYPGSGYWKALATRLNAL